MSKGWGRRPTQVDRSEWEASFDRIFTPEQPLSEVGSEVGSDKCDCWQYDHQVCDICQRVDPKRPQMDPCDIADTMTRGFSDQRSRA